jgi:3-oxoacyl-[acyl-carrier protein] reductase
VARLSQLSRSIIGKSAIVTGGASGMGRATAFLLADEGARVCVVDIGDARVQAVVDDINAAGGTAIGVACDITDTGALDALVADVVAAFAGIDILVNNAGVSMVTSAFQDAEGFDAGWDRTVAVNLSAQAQLIRRALPHLQASGAGRVVNVASTEAIVATAGLAAYTASKHGVVGLTKSMAVELGRHGITVNCICPGPINTNMTSSIGDEAKATYAHRRVPLRRYGEPEEVAHATLSLVLPASSFINGAVLVVDGGMNIRH